MKTFHSLRVCLLSWALLASPSAIAHATVMSLGTVEQPVNLCAAADPSRIPLGPVAVESNHGYGIHEVIVAPRPCQHGAMTWKGGLELNQNLASAFGISLEIDDDTQIHEGTVRMVLRNQPRPEYSPYQREQVVAATLHCLLRSVHATPKSPLRVQIISENPSEQKWIKRFPTEFINRPDREGDVVAFTKIPDTEIQVDEYGVASVVFPKVKPIAQSKRVKPILLPVSLRGGDGDETPIVLMPVWVGDTEKNPFNVIGRAFHLYYDRFNQATPLSQQLHVLHQDRLPVHWTVRDEETCTTLQCYLAGQSQEAMNATLYAAILSIRPTEKKPLFVEMHALDQQAKSIEMTFVLGENGALLRGALPNCELEKTAGGTYMMHYVPEPITVKFHTPKIIRTEGEEPPVLPEKLPELKPVEIELAPLQWPQVPRNPLFEPYLKAVE